jgi:hypothetical protein
LAVESSFHIPENSTPENLHDRRCWADPAKNAWGKTAIALGEDKGHPISRLVRAGNGFCIAVKIVSSLEHENPFN